MACRNRVLNILRKKFKSPKDAEAHYFPISITVGDPGLEVPIIPTLQPASGASASLDLHVICDLFKSYCIEHLEVCPPDDFLQLSLLTMQHLKLCGRSNVLYGLAKALGTWH